MRASLLAAALLATSALPALAQEPKKEPAMDASMMEAMMKAATPGEHHKYLGQMVGDWTYTLKLWMAPGQPPIESQGIMHSEWILGGRYVQSNWKGDMMGQPFEGRGTDGYDNSTGKFFSAWLDNAGTGLFLQTGACDMANKTCTLSGDMVDPMTGKSSISKSVTTIPDADTMKMEMFMKDGGAEMKTMEIVSKRKKK
jgi:hypothetical protein